MGDDTVPPFTELPDRTESVEPENRADYGIEPVDWDSFWKREHVESDFLIEPLVAKGRQTAIFSPAKVGKSLLALDIAAAAATGRSVLGQSPAAPISVVYLDLEMTADDLWERLDEMSYGPDDDLTHLHYYLLPTIPPLDTHDGGEFLAGIAEGHGAEVVIIDTMARAIKGPENDADTLRSFYRWSGLPLKQVGVALLRLDHAGYDPTHPRGTSAKADDVDVTYKLSAVDKTKFRLDKKEGRVPWMPDHVIIVRQVEPVLRHIIAEDDWPAGTATIAALLDELEVPLDASKRTALTALRDVNQGRRPAVVLAALKFRRMVPRTTQKPASGNPRGTIENSVEDDEVLPGHASSAVPGARGNHGNRRSGTMGVSRKGTPGPMTSEPVLTSGDLERISSEDS